MSKLSSSTMTMAELLAKQKSSSNNSVLLSRGQEVEGSVIEILNQEIILDLGTKSEGVLPKKDLSEESKAKLKIGDKILAFVVHPDNESGQVILGLNRVTRNKTGSLTSSARFNKFETALRNNQVLTGKGIEVNKGGLIVEVNGVRGFLPSSQVSLSLASNLDELVDKDLQVTVIEVDSNQNRLIFSQKTNISEDVKKKLSQLKVGDTVQGKVAAVLPFGIFATLENNVEGLVHISEISWDKVEDPSLLYKIGDDVSAKVISTDESTGRVNLSIKQMEKDPFKLLVQNLQPDDVVKGEVTKVSSIGITIILENGVEGLIHSSKQGVDNPYKPGQKISCLVDSIDTQKRRVNLAPLITSTKELIYK